MNADLFPGESEYLEQNLIPEVRDRLAAGALHHADALWIARLPFDLQLSLLRKCLRDFGVTPCAEQTTIVRLVMSNRR